MPHTIRDVHDHLRSLDILLVDHLPKRLPELQFLWGLLEVEVKNECGISIGEAHWTEKGDETVIGPKSEKLLEKLITLYPRFAA
jgi:hypothetical protein